MPQSQKDHNGRYKVRFFLASHRLLMSRKFMSLFIQPSWAKSWAPGCLFAFQLLRQIGNTQNASEEVTTASLNLPFLFECMSDTRQEAWHGGDRGEGGMPLPWACSLQLRQLLHWPSALSWTASTKWQVRHFLCYLQDWGCVRHPKIMWTVDSILLHVPDVHSSQRHSHSLLCAPGIISWMVGS